MKKKLRPLGEVTQDLEDVLMEMCEAHDMQLGEILSLVKNWVEVHYNGAIEEYECDDSNPIFLYGHKDDVKRRASKL